MNNEAISVLMLCYNAADTVQDTLDSIYSQTYPVIDLLINDDASQDETVRIVEDWIDKHESRFHKVELYKNECNEGVNKSFEKLMKKCKTKWGKLIGSDDILLDKCLELNYEYVKTHNIDSILYSKVIPFVKKNGEIIILNKDYYEERYAKTLGNLSPQDQYHKLLRRDIVFSPTGFANIQKYNELGGISLQIRNIEDWPLRLLYASNGYKFYFMDIDTVLYRLSNSVSRDVSKMYKENHLQQTMLVKKLLVYPNIEKWNVLYYFSERMEQFRYFVIIKCLGNKNNSICKFVNKFLMAFEIYRLPVRIQKRFLNGKVRRNVKNASD